MDNQIWISANFDERQQKTIQNAIEYNKDPYGDVAHNLKIIVARLVALVDTQATMLEEFQSKK